MADFDDLIPKSSPAVPGFDNPFADASLRPRSPDPWSMGASYYQQPSSATAFDDDPYTVSGFQEMTQDTDPYSSHTSHSRSESYDDAEDETPEIAQPVPTPAPISVDPLEADAATKVETTPEKRHPFAPLPVVRAPSPPPVPQPTYEPPSTAVSTDPRQTADEEKTSPPHSLPVEVPLMDDSTQALASTFHDPRPPSPPTPVQEPSPTVSRAISVSLSSEPHSTAEPEPARIASPPTSVPTSPNLPSPSAAPAFTSFNDTTIGISPYPLVSSSLQQSFGQMNLGAGSDAPGWGSSPFMSSYSSAPEHVSSPGFRAVPAEADDDDDEDDRPLGLNRNLGTAATSSATVSADGDEHQPVANLSPARPGEKYDFQISVGDPQKVGDPIIAHIVYTVTTYTTDPTYKKSSFSVLRRYSDFLWLFDMLVANNPGVVVPPVPEKKPYGRFAETFVEQRRQALNKCIQKIVDHPKLARDPDLRIFLESDTFALDIKHRRNESGQGLIATIGGTITGPKFYETDEWFDKQKSYLDGLEAQLKSLVKSIEGVAKLRIDVITSIAEFADAVAILGSSDLSKQLSSSLTMMAEVERKCKDLLEEQSKFDVVTVLGTVDEYLRLIASVRLTFASRVKLYYAWKTAESEKIRIRNLHEKTLRQRGLDRQSVMALHREIDIAETKGQETKNEYDACTRLIKAELSRFEHERVMDFKASLEAFLEGMISRQTQIIEEWENYQQLLLKRAGVEAQQQQAVVS